MEIISKFKICINLHKEKEKKLRNHFIDKILIRNSRLKFVYFFFFYIYFHFNSLNN